MREFITDFKQNVVPSLDANERLVFMLRFADGLSPAEIAEVLGLKVDRVIKTIEHIRELASELHAKSVTQAA